ncbi:DUF1800 domain-containing protein [Leucothrix sargassi]|nr:DUF1800 domain-containing protein [Leucothrix sargassi]
MAKLTFEQSKHLVERTGLGPELEMIETLMAFDKQQAINYLLQRPANKFATPLPTFTDYDTLRVMRRKKSADTNLMVNKLIRRERGQLQRWAITELLQSPNALQERMTWFWHNHFTSSIHRSNRTLNLMKQQTLLIRSQAMGNFAELLKAISYDPLMLIYLDGVSNKKGKPNENYARELLELFTLGEGNYTDQDVKEVARAFTGWRINKNNEAVLTRNQYDKGKKTVLGKTGQFTSDDILNILLKHPKTAEFIATKLWAEFISTDTPDQTMIKQWAHTFRSSQYDIKSLLHAVLSSPAFWNESYKGTLIKSPIDMTIGSLRALDLEDRNLPLQSLLVQLRKMGQEPYNPPNVKGWPGGATWVDGATLPLRQQFLRRLTRGNNNQQAAQANEMNMMMQATPKNQMPATSTPTLPIQQWEAWLLPIPAITKVNTNNPRRKLQSLLLDPAYQLK